MKSLTKSDAYRRLSGRIPLHCCMFMLVNCFNQDIMSYYSPCVSERQDCLDKGIGVYPVCSDCTQFAFCDPNTRLGIIKINCPSNLLYDVRTGSCVLNFLAICSSNSQKGSKRPDSSAVASESLARLVPPPTTLMRLGNHEKQTPPASTTKPTSRENPIDQKSTKSQTRPTDQEILGYPTRKESASRVSYSTTPKSMPSAASKMLRFATKPDTSAAYLAEPGHSRSPSYIVYPTNPTSLGISDKTLHPTSQVNINKKTNAAISDPMRQRLSSGNSRTDEAGSIHSYDDINSVNTYGGSDVTPIWTSDPDNVNFHEHSSPHDVDDFYYKGTDFHADSAKDGEENLDGGRGTAITTAPIPPAATTVSPHSATTTPAALATVPVVGIPVLTTAATTNTNTPSTTATTAATIHPAQVGRCLTSCTEVPDGDYQSCVGCHVYVTCSNGLLWNRPCPADLVWDNLQQRCAFVSATCRVPLIEQ